MNLWPNPEIKFQSIGTFSIDIGNPIATILSVAMMFRYSLALEKEAQTIEKAVEDTIKEGYRTYDIMSDGMTKVGTREMGDLISKKVLEKK